MPRQPGDIPGVVLDALARFEQQCRAVGPPEARVGKLREALQALDGTYKGEVTPGTVQMRPPLLNPRGLSARLGAARQAVRDLRISAEPYQAGHAVLENAQTLLTNIESHLCGMIAGPQPGDADPQRLQWCFDNQAPSVVTFPVCVWRDGTEVGDLRYLWAEQNDEHAGAWRFGAFGPRDVTEPLNALGRLAIGLVAGVLPDKVPARELALLRMKYSYELLPTGEIDAGMSHTGAVLVLFVLCYLYAKLGREAARLIQYDPAAVISACIATDGTLSPPVERVEGLEQKLPAAGETWGPGVRFYLPQANAGEPAVAEAAALGRVRLVSTADQLVEQAIRNLDGARDEWLRKIGPDSFADIWGPLFLDPEDAKQRWARLGRGEAVGGRLWRELGPPLLGLLARDGNRAQVTVGFNETAFQPNGQRSRRAVVLAVSATTAQPDQVLWPEPESWPVAALVFQVSQALSGAAQGGDDSEVYVHFLSDPKPALLLRRNEDKALELVDLLQAPPQRVPGWNTRSINELLVRRRAALEGRGRYLRPVLDYWSGQRAHAAVQLYVVSQGEVPDIADEADDDKLPGIARVRRVLLAPPAAQGGIQTWLPGQGLDACLQLGLGREQDAAAVQAEFGSPPCQLKTVRVSLGDICPTRWGSSDGQWRLSRNDGLYALSPRFERPAYSAGVIFEASPAVQVVTLAATYVEQANDVSKEFANLGFAAANVEPLGALESGRLSEEETARLQNPERWCLTGCGHRHLLCNSVIGGAIVFETLENYRLKALHGRSGFFAIAERTGEWWFSDSGLVLPGRTRLVFCNDRAQRLNGNTLDVPGRVEEAFAVEDGGARVYLIDVVNMV